MWRNKGQFKGENKDSYTNQSSTGVHGNANRIFENHWKSQT